MKKNENKVANLISNKVAQQLEGIKDATSKSKTTKAKGTKKTKAQKNLKKLPRNLQVLNWFRLPQKNQIPQRKPLKRQR